jgi:hypothetical protein
MNYQRNAYTYNTDTLFRLASVELTVERNGELVLASRGILAKLKYEDADRTSGQAFTNSMDVLIRGSELYEPKTGDVIRVASGDTYIVRPFANEIWRYDDPYNLVVRIHAQRRSAS